MAAYAALTSLLQILDQLEHHPFPPISLDRQQVDSLTEIATSLQKFLEDYNSPFVDSDEADPLEMRIADVAYAAEDVIESYIVDNIHFAAAATHVDKVMSSGDEERNSNEDASSGGEYSFSGDEEINSDEDASSGGEYSFSGHELNCEEEINPDENASSGGESSFSGDELNCEEEINPDEDASSGGESSFSGGDNIHFAHNDEVNSCSGDQVNSEEEVNSDEDASSGLAGEAINISGEEISCVKLYEDVWKVIEEMDLVKKEAMEKTAVQAHHQLQRNILRSSSFTGKNSSVMVGYEDVLLQLLDKLTGGASSLQVIPITGMGGIGKTTLARNIFQHALVKEHFDICAWVTISQQYNTKQILSQILSQATAEKSEKRDKSEDELYKYLDKSEDELRDELHKSLFGRRYLIIMDDIWSIKVWEEMRLYFPNCENGSRAVVTTRQSFLTSQLTDSNDVFHLKFLDEVNSWNLFSKTVFGEQCFPLQLEKIGKKIVEKCRGLPLSIVVIGGLLAKSQHTHEHWEHIEQNFNSIVNLENDEFCLKVLKLSYHHLPAYLKPSFLYMGSFEEDTRIRVSTLIKLWVSEGFLKPENGKSLETVGEGFLKDLIDRNLILVHGLGRTGKIKYCKMHDLLRDLCLKQAENQKFYHVIGQHGPRGIQNHKRLCMVSDRSTSKKRVLDALQSMRSHVRSFIHRSDYASVGLLPNLRLLRILEADEGPDQYRLEDVIYKLVNSRYVAITNFSEKSKLPSSVNFLWNLHTIRIIGPGGLIVVPVEIWKMSQLRHVEFKWENMYLPDPPSGSSIVILENLQTLTGILNFKCGEEMVKRIPNIKKLEIAYDKIRRHDGDEYCLSNLHSLHKLESLTIESSFPRLKFLELSYSRGLKQWMIENSSHFPCLEQLHLSELKKLEEIPLEIGEIPTLQSIELRYCSESAVRSAKKIVEEQEELQGGEEHLPFLVRVEELYKKQEALQSLASPNFQFKWAH